MSDTPNADLPDDDLELEPPIERPTLHMVSKVPADDALEEDDAPPDDPSLWLGTLAFPWHSETLGVWILLSMGLSATGFLVAVCLIYGGQFGMMVVRAVAPAAGVSAVLSLSYAASCALVVIERTANGIEVIDDWPDINWKDWVWSLGQMFVLAGQASLLGWLVALATCTPAVFVAPIIGLLAFPVLLLAALEADAILLPISPVVFRTLVSQTRTWLVFYGLTSALLVAWILVSLLGVAFAPWLAPLVVGPLLAALFLIEARMLGRLARRVGQSDSIES